MRNLSASALVIAVTGLNAIDNPGPGLAVIRALREGLGSNLRIIGLAYESLEPGIYLHDLVDKTYHIPYPSSGSEALLQRIQYIHNKENLSLIIPNFDAELYNFIKISQELHRMGIQNFLPTHQQLEARDKVHLAAFGEKYQLKIPESILIYRVEELTKAAEELNFPLVIKGKFYEAEVVQTLEHAQRAYYKLSAKWGVPVIAQQFITGSEINIAALGEYT